MPRLPNRVLALTAVLVPALAHAQTGAPASLFLRPGAFDAAPGAVATFQLDSLDGTKPLDAPWPAAIRWLFVRSPGFQENRSSDDAPRPAPGERSIALSLEHPGITLVGLDLPPRIVEWPVDQLRTLQGAVGPDPALPATGAVPVRLVESAKAIVRVGPDNTDSVATGKAGQAVEIRPMMDPALSPIGSDIGLRAFIDGDAVESVVLTATNAAANTTQEIQLNASGAGFFHVSAPGLWRLEFRQARPLNNDPFAKWAVYSATLTFLTPGALPAPAASQEGKP